MSEGYDIDTLTIDNLSWSPVIPPFHCIAIFLRCDSDTTKIRSNPALPAKEDSFGAGVQFVMPGATPNETYPSPSRGIRFRAGVAAGYLQSPSGLQDVKVYYIP